MFKRVVVSVGVAVCYFFSAAIVAKTINLYEQPSDTAKVVGKLNTESGFVPIFTQKNGKWTKIGDPENGLTGWVKSTELAATAGTPNNFSYSQSMVSQAGGVPSMVVRFGTLQPPTDKELQTYLLKSRRQHEMMQRDIQNMMQNFFNTQPDLFGFPYPMVLPVMVMPVQQNSMQAMPATKMNEMKEVEEVEEVKEVKKVGDTKKQP